MNTCRKARRKTLIWACFCANGNKKRADRRGDFWELLRPSAIARKKVKCLVPWPRPPHGDCHVGGRRLCWLRRRMCRGGLLRAPSGTAAFRCRRPGARFQAAVANRTQRRWGCLALQAQIQMHPTNRYKLIALAGMLVSSAVPTTVINMNALWCPQF